MNTENDLRIVGFSAVLDDYEREGRLRHLPPHRAGQGLVDLTGNDYLGLAARQGEFREEYARRFGEASMTSSASRLLATDQKIYADYEGLLEELYGRPALLFNSGYHANMGITRALALPGTVFLSDKLIHASAIDGLRMKGTECDRWRHNDPGHLRKLLEKYAGKAERMVVIAESVYSMDGDLAPLEELAALREEFPNMLLYIDEAHGFGVFGEYGLGLAEELGLLDKIDILMATLGKAGASAGAFAVTARRMKDYLVNAARPLIFSTALPPANVAWSQLMTEKITGMGKERKHLRELASRLKAGLRGAGGGSEISGSQIVPFITGDARKATRLAAKLEAEGILASAIRRPTVPPGGERLRLSLNALLSEADIDNITEKLKE